MRFDQFVLTKAVCRLRAAQLDERLVLLRDSDRGLADALDSAWASLEPEVCDALVRLAAVRTPLTLAAAEATGSELRQALPRLTDAGWVELRAEGGATRLALPANQRAWLEGQPGDEARCDARERLVGWLCSVGNIHAAEASAGAPGASRWLIEHAELLVELALTHHGARLPALAGLAALALDRRGALPSAVDLLRRALQLGQPAPADRVRLLVWLGIALRGAAPAEALGAHEQAAEVADALGAPQLRAKAWAERALSAGAAGLDAGALAERAVDIASQADPDSQAYALFAAFHATTCRGGGAASLSLLERAVGLPLSPLSPLRGLLQLALGAALREAGRLLEAEDLYLGWLSEHIAAPLHQRLAVQANLDMLLQLTGRFDEGEDEIEAVLDLAYVAGVPDLTATLLGWRLRARLAAGLPWGQLLAALEGWPQGRAWLGLVSGLAALREGDPFSALARLDPPDAVLLEDTLPKDMLPLALAASAAASAWLGRLDQAAERAAAARQAACTGTGALAAELAWAWVLWGRRDPAAAEAFAAFDRGDAPWIASPRQRLLELRWLTPADLGLRGPGAGC